ncbi:MAG: tetratricopeptide repeat protein, partial [bacterium]
MKTNSFIFKFGLLPLLAVLLGCAGQPSFKKDASEKQKAATGRYKSHHEADPRATDLVVRGALAEMKGEFGNALNAYQEALLFDSTSVSLHIAIAEIYLKLNRAESAIQMLKRGLRLDPRSIE